jgi:hypothetical protein
MLPKMAWRARHPASVLVMLFALAPPLSRAAPYVPDDEDVVLLKLPADARPELAVLDGIGAGESASLTDAERLSRARQHVQLALASGAPEGFGYAEALLQPWWTQPPDTLTTDTALLIAFVLQHDHRFSAALDVLDAVLLREPGHTQALLLRAQIRLVTAAYPAARRDCAELALRTTAALASNCLAQVQALTGGARRSFALLDGLLAYADSFSAADAYELRLTLALVAEQLDMGAEALARFRELHRAQPGANFVLLHLAAQLLRQRRYAEALALLERLPAERLGLDLQISLLEALQGCGEVQRAEQLREKLAAIFAESAARSDGFPHKEWARFLLVLQQDPDAALAAAQANWNTQKEPDDLLLLARAAVAARDAGALALVRDWLHTTGLEDARTRALVAPGDR